MDSPYLLREIAAAGIGCAIADSLFNPLEVVKVRMQVDGGNGSVISMRRLITEIFNIYKSEGILGLWTPGLFPTFVRGLLYAGSRIGMYPSVKSFINERVTPMNVKKAAGDKDSLFITKLLAGALCGAFGSLIFNPLDLVRINFQRNPKAYPSTATAFIRIYNASGIRGLWSGSSATVMRATLLSGSQLSIYDQIKTFAATVKKNGNNSRTPLLEEGPLLHSLASLISGIIAQAVIMPVDTLKTKMMVRDSSMSFSSTHLPSRNVDPRSLFGAYTAILREGGYAGFYRGFAPALLRQGPCILVQVDLLAYYLSVCLLTKCAYLFTHLNLLTS